MRLDGINGAHLPQTTGLESEVNMDERIKELAAAAKRLKIDKTMVADKLIQAVREQGKVDEDLYVRGLRERAGDLLDAVGLSDDDIRGVVRRANEGK